MEKSKMHFVNPRVNMGTDEMREKYAYIATV